MISTVDIKSMSLEECRSFFESIGEPGYRADQVLEWLYRGRVSSYDAMTNIPRLLRVKLAEIAPLGPPEILARRVSPDGDSVKYLIGLADDNAVEAVLMRHDYGLSLCVSSQVGCPMGCAFCASGIGGLVRDLTCGEIVDQLVAASGDAAERFCGARISSLVVMGSGEPLLNYDNVMKFVRLANWSRGFAIGYRHITISTCGIVPGIVRLAGEGIPLTLSVSLHAPDDATRSSIMKVNTSYPISTLVKACNQYAQITGRRVTYEYALIAGVNDSQAHAERLAGLLRGTLCHVNLIPLNPVPETPYERPASCVVEAFAGALESRGIEATIRREMGSGIDAACGQLRRRLAPRGGAEEAGPR